MIKKKVKACEYVHIFFFLLNKAREFEENEHNEVKFCFWDGINGMEELFLRMGYIYALYSRCWMVNVGVARILLELLGYYLSRGHVGLLWPYFPHHELMTTELMTWLWQHVVFSGTYHWPPCKFKGLIYWDILVIIGLIWFDLVKEKWREGSQWEGVPFYTFLDVNSGQQQAFGLPYNL